MKKAFLALTLIGLAFASIAQDTSSKETTAYRYTPSPDFPGSLVIDYGLNYFNQNSAIMDTKAWKSPSLNVYYMYPFRMGASRFSFNVGAGVGSDKFTFNSPVTLIDDGGLTAVDSITNIAVFANSTGYKKTQFVANYVDIPFELRVHTRKNDHKRSWFLAVGGKVGFRFASKTKVVYEESGAQKKYKNLYHYNLNPIRYGAIARVGIGPFSFWGYYSFNPFFKDNKISGIENPTTFTVGLSLSTF